MVFFVYERSLLSSLKWLKLKIINFKDWVLEILSYKSFEFIFGKKCYRYFFLYCLLYWIGKDKLIYI